ncbi:SDR family NAD(P)-dependent oxidoreductase [Desertimonas flava]|uniref:SDR family NAD(P)-dependent oxidoreductase n=1 Tax=Desertimonas flava TaxID=2064846 RepID=UPI0019692359|nr:SDR family oxidoreductase [Desertimonas flava]
MDGGPGALGAAEANHATNSPFRLDGLVSVVTGGAGLYGVGLVEAMAAAGATVVIASRDTAATEAVAARLCSEGRSAVAVELDLADEASIVRFRDHVVAEFGRFDVLVNNAVTRRGGTIDTVTFDDLLATTTVNFAGLLTICRYAGEQMKRQRSGAIVNVSSIYGMVGPQLEVYEGTPLYNPAYYAFDKGGMINLTRHLAADYGRWGIRVNCVSPGGLHTPDQPASFVEAYRRRTPLGRMATGADLAGPVVFLASPAAAYVTGVNLPVDGGWTAI